MTLEFNHSCDFNHSDEVIGHQEIAFDDDKRAYIDWDKADEVIGTLVNTYLSKGYPYNQPWCVLPEKFTPEKLPKGGKEHAMFLWNVCLHMRGWNQSVVAFKHHADLYNQHPEIYDASIAMEMEPASIESILKEYKLTADADKISLAWVENSKRMQESWDGDPRNIFIDVNSYKKVLKRTKNDKKGGGFWGFQDKITSMAIYYLTEADLIERFSYPAPSDMHLNRIATSTEMVRYEGFELDDNVYTFKTQNVIRHLFHEFAKKYGLDPNDLAKAVWLFSGAMCSYNPGNVTLEPNRVENRKKRTGRGTVFVPLPIETSNHKQQMDYYRSCGMCAIEHTCKWNVPGKLYYRQGKLIRRGERIKFPEPYQTMLVDRNNEINNY